MWQVVILIQDFILKAVSSALFGILLLLAFIITNHMGENHYLGLYRYDYLLIYAIIIQVFLIYFKLESWQEAKVIALFHLLGFIMELFLTHPNIASWHYPQPAVFKIYTVPLFAGFMYSSVGSFFARCLRLYQIEFLYLPKFSLMLLLAILSYVNFMTKFFIPDFRYLLFAGSVYLFYPTKVKIYIKNKSIQLPMLILLVVFAFFIWLAENISTFYRIWLYPTQIEQWHWVGLAKMGSWYLLLLLSLVLVIRVVYLEKKIN